MSNDAKKIPINILFLDDESVLCTNRVHFSKLDRRKPYDEYDPVVVEFLENVCTKFLTFVVITSSKRSSYTDKNEYKSHMIRCNGSRLSDFLLCHDELWRTPVPKSECKALDIGKWFDKFYEMYEDRYYVKNYAIIDTESLGKISMYDNNFVKVRDKHDGMGTHEFRETIKVITKRDLD